MAYTVWVDADGYATAEFQVMTETKSMSDQERRDLVKMDCGKIVVQVHVDMAEAEAFVGFVGDHDKAIKIATLYKRFCRA